MRYRVAFICCCCVLSAAVSFAQTCDLSAGSLFQPNEGPTDYALHLQPSGDLKAVMIFVDFPDAPQSETTTSLYNLLAPDAVSWYSEVSYGRMSLNITPVHTWFRMPANSASYGFGDGLTFAEHRAYIADAIAASDSAVNYSAYRIVYVVAAKNSAITFSPAFHAYPGTGIAVDGVEIRHSATFGEDIRVARPNYGSNVLKHETGHLIGLPDLYEFGAPDLYTAIRFVGGWDTMSFVQPGAHFNAWHKRKLGWLDPAQIVCMPGPGTQDVTLTPMSVVGGMKAVIAKLSASTAYVVEVRQPTNRDAQLCDHGVLIYTVDATVPNGSGPVRLAPAHSGTDPAKIDACGPLYDAPYDLAPGETGIFTDAAAGFSVELLSTAGSGYMVRVTRSGGSDPDLIEAAVSNPPAAVALKQKFSVTDSAQNQGGAATVATNTRYYFSTDAVKSTADKALGAKRSVPALAAGATSTGTLMVQVPTMKRGIYYLIACADATMLQSEGDETNNCTASATTVEVRAPDVVIAAVSNPPSTAVRGSTFSVTDTTRNDGDAPAAASTTRYRLSLDTKKSSSDILLTGTRTVAALAAGAASTGTVSVTIPTTAATGTYYLIACGDDLKKSLESDEKNNCKASATKVTVNP